MSGVSLVNPCDHATDSIKICIKHFKLEKDFVLYCSQKCQYLLQPESVIRPNLRVDIAVAVFKSIQEVKTKGLFKAFYKQLVADQNFKVRAWERYFPADRPCSPVMPGLNTEDQSNACHNSKDTNPGASHKITPASSTPAVTGLKTPLIFISDTSKWVTFCKSLCEVTDNEFSGNLRNGNLIQLRLTSDDDFVLAVNIMRELKMDYFTRQRGSRAPLKYVVRGLSLDVTVEDVSAELTLRGFKPSKVTRLSNKNSALPLVFVELPPGDCDKDFGKLQVLLSHKVSIEPLRNKAKPLQCYRCQGFWHVQRNCHAKVKCVKCAEGHYSYECQKDCFSEPPTCANCGGPHTANYRKCEHFPKI